MKNPIFPLVSISWLKNNLEHPNLIILDTTIKKVTSDDKTAVTNKIIPGARFFDIKGMFSDKETNIPNMLPSPEVFEQGCRRLGIQQDSQIVVYDQLGIYSGPRVWWMFKAMGFHNVAVVDGGLPAWIDANYPLEDLNSYADIPYEKGNFKAAFKPNSVVSQEDVYAIMHNPDVLILDARSYGRFIGTEPEPRNDLKSGHIPGSISLPYTEVLADGKMKSVEELKIIFTALDLGNKKLIFSCGSGITACIILLAAEIAGYSNLSVYDGSWSEWGLIEGLPIEC